MILQETYKLENGTKIPKLGLGTWCIDNDKAAQTVRTAVTLGYRLIDTAQAYENEQGVGEGIRSCSVSREELFVASKVAAELKTYEAAAASIEETLEKMGYGQYEISNFAKPGYECRHNIGYWKRVDYLGVGLGASSLIDNVRYSNTRDLYTYLSECENIHDCYMQYPLTEGVTGSAVYSADGTHILVPAVNLHAAAEQTTRNEQMEEFMFLGLRMRDGFYREEFTQAFGIPIEAVYGDALNHLQQEELLLKREGRIYLTDKGMDLNNYVVAQFML